VTSPTARNFRPWTWWRAWIDAVITYVAGAIACLLLVLVWNGLFVKMSFDKLPYERVYMYASGMILFQIVELGLLWLFALRRGYSNFDLWSGWFGVPKKIWWYVLTITIPYAMLSAFFLEAYFPESYASDIQGWSHELNSPAMPLIVFAAVVLAPLCEELIFRRLLIESAKPGFAAVVLASVASSAVWSIVHWYSWVSTIELFAFGLFLCWLALRCRSIWPGILVHALYNGYAMWALANYAPQP
jgi:membrane protease YdiL (CAAX protease family)